MFWRAVIVWLGLVVVAILNGLLREAVLVPRMPARGAHVVSTLLLCALIAAVAWWTSGWIAPGTRDRAAAVGGLWVVLTLAFEFLAGRYVFGNSWQSLVADYNVARGRIWPLVPIVTFLAPIWANSR